jgi:hypothetical protein
MNITTPWTINKTPAQVKAGTPGVCPQAEPAAKENIFEKLSENIDISEAYFWKLVAITLARELTYATYESSDGYPRGVECDNWQSWLLSAQRRVAEEERRV